MHKNEWFQWRAEVPSCRECPSITKVWLGALETFTNGTGYGYPNQDQIAKAMGRDTRSNLHRCSKQAAKCGHVVIGTVNRSNNYQLTLINKKVEDHHSGCTTTITDDALSRPYKHLDASVLIAALNYDNKTGADSIKSSLPSVDHFLVNDALLEARDNAKSN